MSKKPMPSDLEQFVVSLFVLCACGLLFLIALVIATYIVGTSLADYIEDLGTTQLR